MALTPKSDCLENQAASVRQAPQGDMGETTAKRSPIIMSYSEAIRDGIRSAMKKDDRVYLLGEDVADYGGVYGVTKGLFAEFGKKRVKNTPLSELAILGEATGAAIAGLRPIAEIQFSDFLTSGFSVLVDYAAPYRFRMNTPVPMVVRAPFGGGLRVGPYHSKCPEAWFFHVPGLKIVCPSTPADAKGLLLAAVEDEDPVIFFEHKKLYYEMKEDVSSDLSIPLGKAVIRKEGTHITVVTYGAMVHLALKAARELEGKGIHLEVLDLRSLVPLDEEAILNSVAKTNRVIVLHEAPLRGGVGGELESLICEKAFDQLIAPPVRIGSKMFPVPVHPALEDEYLPSLADLITTAERLMNHQQITKKSFPTVSDTPKINEHSHHEKTEKENQISLMMPQFGESMTSGHILKWLKKEGDLVSEGEPLVEMETEKSIFAYESPFQGKLQKINAKENTEMAVGLCIAEFEVSESDRKKYLDLGIGREILSSEKKSPTTHDQKPSEHEKTFSPLIRALAKENHISQDELESVVGSGLDGRMTKDDFLKYLESRRSSTSVSTPKGVHQNPVSAIRARIAEKMEVSRHTIPHAGCRVEVDVSQVKEKILPRVIFEVSRLLEKWKWLNSSWKEENAEKQIETYDFVHMGIAVSSDQGLLVPVLRNSESKSLVDIESEVTKLVTRAREGRLNVEELTGATFTVNNTGALGAVQSFQIIPPPQAAILAVNQVVKRPWVVDDQIVVRPIMALDLMFDHRIVDGFDSLGFLTDLKKVLEKN